MANSPPLSGTTGEFELIERLTGILKRPLPPGVVGSGDDCAGVPIPGGMQLLTCDVAVAGRHFLPERTPMADVGWRIATANVSDVCACGGQPLHALVSLGVPATFPGTPVEQALEELYRGLDEAGASYGFQVLGGNVSGASELIVDLFMVGETPRFIPRGGAKPGDLIAVSGALGGAACGLEAFNGSSAPGAGPGGAPLTPAAEAVIARHLRPRARLDLAPLLQSIASAAIDISDGLASELHHLAKASGVKLEIAGARVPCLEAMKAYLREQEGGGTRDVEAISLAHALGSGEEYELLFALPPSAEGQLAGSGVTVIGEAREGAGVTLDGTPLPPSGWDHLKGL